MKKLISILFTAVLVSLFSVTAFATEFDPSLTVDRSTDGIILVEIADDEQTNEVLADKQPSLTITCDWASVKLLGNGGHTALVVTDGKVSFTVTHGGTYVITNQEYSVDTTQASCTEDGKYVYTIGSNTYEESIPATGHDFSNIRKRTCADCEEPNPYYEPYRPPVIVIPKPDEEPEPEPTPEPTPEIPVNPFYDIAESDYYYDAVLWAVSEGVTSGQTSNTFAPLLDCTRAQVVTFLWRAAGSPEPVGAGNAFTDVDSGSYYEKAVQWAVENGITTGTTSTTFSPDMIVTRAQVVTFLWRTAGCPAAYGVNSFADVPTDAYYSNAVQWAVRNGITTGTGANLFSPDANCTRAQVVTFLYRYCTANQ